MTGFRASLSISPFAESQLAHGVTYEDGQRTASTLGELQDMFHAHGGTEMWMWMSTRRGPGRITLEHGLQRARMAAERGLPFNPQLALWGGYGDFRCQSPPRFEEYAEVRVPGPWHELTLDQMCRAVQDYAAVAAREIVATGAEVEIWDFGNEVDLGIAGLAIQPMDPSPCDRAEGTEDWYRPPDAVNPEIGRMTLARLWVMTPAERIEWLRLQLWTPMARLLAAAADGVRTVDPDARFSTHLGMGIIEPDFAVAFFETMAEGGYRVDEAGFSHYPSGSSPSDERHAALRDSMVAVHRAMGAKVFVAEYAYPASPMTTGDFASWNHPLSGYPISVEGQRAMLSDFVSWGLDSGVMAGIRPWAAELVAGEGWAPMALFSLDGGVARARPALSAIRDALGPERTHGPTGTISI